MFTNRLLGHFVLAAFSADLAAPLFAAMRTARISSISVKDGGDMDLTQVTTELRMIVDELEGFAELLLTQATMPVPGTMLNRSRRSPDQST